MGLKDDYESGLARGYLAYKIDEMAKAISKNETMAKPISSLKEFKKSRQRIILRLRDPKNTNVSIGLSEKPPHPKSEDFFNSTRGGAISLEFNDIKNQKNFFDLILENKDKISFIVICGTILYICFKKFSFVRNFYQKIKKISNHWIFNNRLTRGIIVSWRCTS